MQDRGLNVLPRHISRSWTSTLLCRVLRLSMSLAALCTALTTNADALGQLVVATPGSEITLIDLSGANAPRALVLGQSVAGLAADDTGGVLYWTTSSSPRKLWKVSYTNLDNPVEVGNLNANCGLNGLAWDSVDHQLIGFDNCARAFAIDANTAAMTQLVAWPSYENAMYGADFDPDTNSFFGTAPVFVRYPNQAPRMIRKISKPWTNPTVSNIAAYPSAVTGFQGLAIGFGRCFLLGGTGEGFAQLGTEPVEPNRVFNLATNTYEPPMDLSAFGPLVGAAWAPGLMTLSPGVDLVVSAGASEDCTVPAGGTLVFSMRVDNYGTAASGPATLTVNLAAGADAAFVDAAPPPSSNSPTQLTFEIPNVPAFGPTGHATFEIHLAATTPGATVSFNATVAAPTDSSTFNNSASASVRIRPSAPSSAPIKGIFSTDPNFANSLIPGGGGVRFIDFSESAASDDRAWWLCTGLYLPTPVIPETVYGKYAAVRTHSGGAPQLLLNEHAPNFPGTLLSNGFRLKTQYAARVNNSGLVAFSGFDTGPSSTSSFMATTPDGVHFTDFGRKGAPFPTLPSVQFGEAGINRLFNNGTSAITYYSPSYLTTGVLITNGSAPVVRTGTTVPGGAMNPINSTPSFVCFDSTGSHHTYRATIGTGDPSNNDVFVVDGAVVLQEGTTIVPGTGRPFSGQTWLSRMAPDGSWMLCDAYYPEADAVIRGSGSTIVQVFKTGDPIVTGSTEHWSDARGNGFAFSPGNTFFTSEPGVNGHYVIGGFTDSENEWTDSVLVYDNRVVIARENDPVDLDGNGVFDDHVYIASFVRMGAVGGYSGEAVFTNDHAILIVVALRDERSALGHLGDLTVSRALVRVPLPGCNAADVARLGGVGGADGQLTVDDLVYFLSQFFAGNVAVADIAVLGSTPGHDGQITVDDLVYYLSQFFAGCP